MVTLAVDPRANGAKTFNALTNSSVRDPNPANNLVRPTVTVRR